MGLIKSIVVDVIEGAVDSVVEGAAIVAASGIVTAGAVAVDATAKAAEGVVVAAKATGKGVKTVTKGVVSVSKSIGQGISKANNYIKELKEPLIQKKIEKLYKEADELYLFSIVDKKDKFLFNIYTHNIEPCFVLEKDKLDINKYYLSSVNGKRIATFAKGKKLFKKFISINTIDNKTYTFERDKSDDDKTKYLLNENYKIVKSNMMSGLEFYDDNNLIGKMKSNPVSDVEYAIQVFDEEKDLEVFIMSICRIIY